jgi:hypothetical protein
VQITLKSAPWLVVLSTMGRTQTFTVEFLLSFRRW